MIFKRNSEGAVDLDAGQHDQPSSFLNVKHQHEYRFYDGASVSKEYDYDIGLWLPLIEHASKIIVSANDYEDAINK